ncbi:MAG: hypothetical protein WBD22_14370, partial [Pyrinomonadaceae bacterium]
MMWALALNGFMGQQRAVDTSMVVYFVLAIAAAILNVSLSVVFVYFLSGRRGWRTVLSSLLSIVVFVAATGVFHTACVIISAIVAGQLRTNR